MRQGLTRRDPATEEERPLPVGELARADALYLIN